MFLVTGGYFGGYLDSTEIFDPNLGSWSAGATLPSPDSLRATNLDNRVLLFGIHLFIYKNLYIAPWAASLLGRVI